MWCNIWYCFCLYLLYIYYSLLSSAVIFLSVIENMNKPANFSLPAGHILSKCWLVVSVNCIKSIKTIYWPIFFISNWSYIKQVLIGWLFLLLMIFYIIYTYVQYNNTTWLFTTQNIFCSFTFIIVMQYNML